MLLSQVNLPSAGVVTVDVPVDVSELVWLEVPEDVPELEPVPVTVEVKDDVTVELRLLDMERLADVVADEVTEELAVDDCVVTSQL
jgi:hypothetical protein